MVWMLYSVSKRYVLICNLLLGQDSIYEEDLIQINLQILTVFDFAIFFVDTIFAIQFYKGEQKVQFYAGVAQGLEHLPSKQEVVGSFPISSTSEFTYMNAIPIDFARECRVYFGLFVYRQDATMSRWQAEFDSLIDRIIIFFVSLQIINNDYLRRKMYSVCEYRVHFYPRLAQLDQSESFLNSRLQVRFLYRGHFVLQA